MVRLYHLGEIDDEYIVRENARLKQDKQRLEERKGALFTRLEARTINQYQVEAIVEYCNRVAKNIEQFSYEDKRLALEALSIEVIVKNYLISVYGSIPISASGITSPQSWLCGSNDAMPFSFDLTVGGRGRTA